MVCAARHLARRLAQSPLPLANRAHHPAPSLAVGREADAISRLHAKNPSAVRGRWLQALCLRVLGRELVPPVELPHAPRGGRRGDCCVCGCVHTLAGSKDEGGSWFQDVVCPAKCWYCEPCTVYYATRSARYGPEAQHYHMECRVCAKPHTSQLVPYAVDGGVRELAEEEQGRLADHSTESALRLEGPREGPGSAAETRPAKRPRDSGP